LPGLIVFEFHKPGQRDRVAGWLAEAGTRAQADGLLMMIEPEPICCADTGRTTAEMIRRAGVPSLRINYDPGNVAWQTGRDPIDEFDIVAPLIANVHVKDLLAQDPHRQESGYARTSRLCHWLPAGEGIIDCGSAETTRACKNAIERLWEGRP